MREPAPDFVPTQPVQHRADYPVDNNNTNPTSPALDFDPFDFSDVDFGPSDNDRFGNDASSGEFMVSSPDTLTPYPWMESCRMQQYAHGPGLYSAMLPYEPCPYNSGLLTMVRRQFLYKNGKSVDDAKCELKCPGHLLLCRQNYTEEAFHERYRDASGSSMHCGLKFLNHIVSMGPNDYR